MGGQQHVIDIRPSAEASPAVQAAQAYREYRIKAASRAMRAGQPVSTDDQLRLMTQLIGLADELVTAVLNER